MRAFARACDYAPRVTRRPLRILLIVGLPLVCATGLFVASAVNWQALRVKVR